MKRSLRLILVTAGILIVCGCSYRAYLGLHGASIKLYPDEHESAVSDNQCLECHHPDSAEGPPTPHPNFKGCLKCHNDEIISE